MDQLSFLAGDGAGLQIIGIMRSSLNFPYHLFYTTEEMLSILADRLRPRALTYSNESGVVIFGHLECKYRGSFIEVIPIRNIRIDIEICSKSVIHNETFYRIRVIDFRPDSVP